MTKEEYHELRYFDSSKDEIITIDDLLNKEPRTLLWGFTCTRDSWHVYIKDGEIHVVRYPYCEKPVEVLVSSNHWYVPDKRLYPEACDYEFCKLLREHNIYLPFTTWNDKRTEKQYHGLTLEDEAEPRPTPIVFNASVPGETTTYVDREDS